MTKKNNGGGMTAAFAERNIKELLRSPVGWALGLALPVGLFVIMQVIVKSVGSDAVAQVPMFAVSRFTGGAIIFGTSFLSIFAALLISGDRQSSFLSRLFVSPMPPRSFILGYVLGIMPIAAAQVAITFCAALCFGLPPTPYILLAAVYAAALSLLFVSIGVMFGSSLSAKSAPPACSAVVQIAALLSGMWFDLDAIGGGFDTFCHVLPFAHGYDLIRYTLAGELGKTWLPLTIVVGYTVAAVVAAVLLFERNARK